MNRRTNLPKEILSFLFLMNIGSRNLSMDGSNILFEFYHLQQNIINITIIIMIISNPYCYYYSKHETEKTNIQH